jgi:ADP-ribose pyrophosphatase
LREDTIDGAKRELREETGYITNDIKEVGSYYSGAYSEGVFVVFLAKNCIKYGDQELDQTEFIEHLIWSTAEFEAYFKSEPTNGQCLLAYFLAKPYF